MGNRTQCTVRLYFGQWINLQCIQYVNAFTIFVSLWWIVFLADTIFETGAYGVPSKSQNPNCYGSRGSGVRRSDRFYSSGNRGVKKGLGPREFLLPSLVRRQVSNIHTLPGFSTDALCSDTMANLCLASMSWFYVHCCCVQLVYG